jgi:DNA helicase-2/ATP-dependent DNA helicase PcrA
MKAIGLIGGAGTGKTSKILEIMSEWIEKHGVNPFQIGFVSFTQAARQEACERAAEMLNMEVKYLMDGGWFRTLHAACYRLTEAHSKKLITDTKESKEWISDVTKERISGLDDGLTDIETFVEKQPADIALALWGAARNRMVPLRKVWEEAYACDRRTPGYDVLADIVAKFETAKFLENRYDFTDLLARYAGIKFDLHEYEEIVPMGEVPQIKIWFLDEAQDNSALSDRVARRLTEDSDWVYLAGDPFQSIYGWSGSNPVWFQNWPQAKRRVLQQTYRCPAPIVDLGESLLRGCTDYWDRGIKPAPHDGRVEVINFNDPSWVSELRPENDILILARTHFLVKRLASRLHGNGIPYGTTTGVGTRWCRSKKNVAIMTARSLQQGEPITFAEWTDLLSKLPVKHKGATLLQRGTKTKWKDWDIEPHTLADIATIPDWGATSYLCQAFATGAWLDLVEGAVEVLAAFDKWGVEQCVEPQIRLGTIHSAKGMEADKVILLTTTTQQCERQAELQGDEEQRLKYVAVTRTRKDLIILNESEAKFFWSDPELQTGVPWAARPEPENRIEFTPDEDIRLLPSEVSFVDEAKLNEDF